MLRQLGIHWCFIPKRWRISVLESPVKLLDRWIEHVLMNQENMDKRVEAAQLEADYHNEIEEEEDETIGIID